MANNGMKGKFRDRLKLIVIKRREYLKGIISNKEDKDNKVYDNDKFIRDKISYIRRVLEQDRKNNLSNGYVYKKKKVGIGDEDSDKNVVDKDIVVISGKDNSNKVISDINNKDVSNVSNRDVSNKDVRDVSNREVRDVSNIGNRDVSVKGSNVSDKDRKSILKDNKKGFFGDINKYRRNKVRRRVGIGDNISDVISSGDVKSKDKVKEELGCKIVKKIKGKLEDSINELDVLESELYILSEDNNKELELKRVEEIKKKIEDVLRKIEEIKREYEIFRNNYYLEDVTDLDDGLLIDDIINYKRLLDSYEDNRNLVKEYKLLDEYKDLGNKIDEINEIKDRVVSLNDKKLSLYKDRDRKYKIICDKVIVIDDIKKSVEDDIDKQNKYIDDLMGKINKIDKNEYSIYRVKGLGELIGHSLKYVGLMMVSPLLGFLPGITASTIATRNMIKNIRNNMRVEEIKRVRYEANDFNSEIINKLNDIDYTYYVIDDTLGEISRLKNDFLRQYDSHIEGYFDTLNKINMIEGSVINSRKKVDIIKRRMVNSKKINEDKIRLVRKLNRDN